jgi:L-serine dehydratase
MISAFDLFKIGIGPSSSHTVGPMKAAADAAARLAADPRVVRVETTLFGSLAWTGRGHETDRAVALGLGGLLPATVDPDDAAAVMDRATGAHRLALGGVREIGFDPARDIVFDHVSEAPRHPNTLRFRGLDAAGAVLAEERWCSVGGGFVVPEDEVGAPEPPGKAVPYPFTSGDALLLMAAGAGLSIADVVWANELALRPAAEVTRHLTLVAETMMLAIARGSRTEGELPGGLRVRRRAASLRAGLDADIRTNRRLAHEVMDRVSLYAIAVNEENAAGGRIVTAPTNGAAGVVPAVLRYVRDERPATIAEDTRVFLLTATAVGGLFKLNASISGAEVGCQGEVGVACSMAAAGLCAVLGGTNAQVENAAEIAMEHHLGMTCDPIGGLVQIPCIERNAFGALKAINAAALALRGDGTHRVSLDQVVATMRQTGADMQSKYKETSQGGLAVNWTEC